MGARPLKRAIDQYLLAPLAATMVERRFPTGDQFLFVRSDGESIQVEFVDPNSEPAAPVPAVGEPAAAVASTGIEALASAVMQPTGLRTEREQLSAALARLEAQLAGAEWRICAMNSLRRCPMENSGTATIDIACSRDSHSWIA